VPTTVKSTYPVVSPSLFSEIVVRVGFEGNAVPKTGTGKHCGTKILTGRYFTLTYRLIAPVG